jgi:hypothetical protein
MAKKAKAKGNGLDVRTLVHVLELVRKERDGLERSAKRAGREGGVLLSHAADEWARATECARIINKLHGLIEGAVQTNDGNPAEDDDA